MFHVRTAFDSGCDSKNILSIFESINDSEKVKISHIPVFKKD